MANKKKLQLEIDETTLLPLFYKILDSEKEFVVCRGSKGSGKTTAILQALTFKCCSKITKVLVVKLTLTSMEETIIKPWKKILAKWNLLDRMNFNNQSGKQEFIFPNGSSVIFRGADNADNLQGLEVNYLFVDECTQLDLETFQDIADRVRIEDEEMQVVAIKNNIEIANKDKDYKLQTIIAFNPVSETSWVKSYFHDNEEIIKYCDYFPTTCLDNKFLSQKTVEKYRRYAKTDYNKYRVVYLGEWGETNKDHTVYSCFNTTIHLESSNYDPSKPLHISLDDNVNPFCPLIVSQISVYSTYTEIRVIQEFCIPNLNMQKVCEEFCKKYSGHKAGLFIYGDATSFKKSNVSDYNFFQLIVKYLAEFNPQTRLLSANPPVKQRIDFVNKLLYENDKVQIKIDHSCTNLIRDLECGKLDAEGKKDKKTARNKTTGVNYQIMHHCSDAFEYFLIPALPKFWSGFNGSMFSQKPTFVLRQTIRNIR